jgi:tRNA-specific 2-thiouridylase
MTEVRKAKKKRVVVAMSGGVDSSVTAALLKTEGYEVIGMTMCFNLADTQKKKPNCCGPQGIKDARRIASLLDIRHYVLNMQSHLEKYVIADFCQEYLKGRTPNPCVRCNQYLKFDILLKKAYALEAQYLATGHYARIAEYRRGFTLEKAKDKIKDQSYFLYRLEQRQLKHLLFPLADYTKQEVRKLAARFKLPVAEKLASQEICFLPTLDYRKFLQSRFKHEFQPGPVVDKEGNILGQHKGIAFYTIGQREGLGIARGYPVYIIAINPQKNEIVLGEKEDAYHAEFIIRQPHFILEPAPKKKIAVRVRIRYNHKEAPAKIFSCVGGMLRVKFKRPQFAVTCGQSAVFYLKDRVLGGGVIDEVL